MDIDTLKKAKELDSKIKLFTEALNSFSWKTDNGLEFSTNPAIIIEYDGNNEGREKLLIPAGLNKEIITVIKEWITVSLQSATDEFEKL